MFRLMGPAGIVIAAIINLLPVPGVLGAGWLKTLYGFDVTTPDLEILLRHRALLFGIIGLLLLASIPWSALRGAAVLAALASMASFIVIALIVGSYGPAIHRVIVADMVGLVALLPATIRLFSSSQRSE